MMSMFRGKKRLIFAVVAAYLTFISFWLILDQTALDENHPTKQNYPLKRQSSQGEMSEENELVFDWSTTSSASETKHFTPPSDALDPNSAYYGNIYKDMYGHPVRNASIYGNETFKVDWKKYFPAIITSLKKYEVQNPTRDPAAFTSETSTVSLETSNKAFKVGDVLVAHIQAKDRLNRSKTFGGDYFRARLIRTEPNGNLTDGIACKVKDHLNGSYTLQAPLLMAGTFILEVKLAILQTNETVECNMDLNTYDGYEKTPMCDYGNPRNGETWFCVLPPSRKCSPITWLVIDRRGRVPPFDYKIKYPPIYGNVTQIVGSGTQVNVSLGAFNDKSIKVTDLPSVYLHQGNWINTLSSKPISSSKNFHECLEHKPVYMFGDSTIRQFFYLFKSKFDLELYGPDSSKVWQQPKTARSKEGKSKITLYYRAHGPPLGNPGPPSSRPYITDSIDGIKVENESQVYVIFNIGLHLLQDETSLYVRRLLSIKEAIIRHHKSFSNSKFIVRGMNVVETIDEWLIMRYETLLREIFKKMTNVFYLNLWDMTTVIPLSGYHPTPPVLNQEALLLLNLLCEA
ncbi:NXPE family member 3-like isoform X2 [Clavelina lepadiformis]|uniref:NXPE family member 3-like isoform X2 n=1 Tax=Clavelina lepadiformis TaxID=159417 RepID=UPI0040436FB6